MYTLTAITGPTASGKTARAIEIARERGAEIVSFDSRQFYRGMDIGTAKPSAEELAVAPHHFIGHLPIDARYSVGDYERDALACIAQIRARGREVVLVGGSGLYLEAIEHGLDHIPDVSPQVRKQVAELEKREGLEALQRLLAEKDPAYYRQVDLKNPRRVARALEVCLASGQPYSSFRGTGRVERPFRVERINLELPRAELYARIDSRVDRMMEQGLLREVESLLPYRHCNAMQSVGYREFFDYFDGRISLEQAVELVKQHSRNYAKRQITWFAHR